MAELERIFASSLKTNFDLRLWKLYIGYVKASAGGIEQDPNKTVIKAFELAIGHVGGDLYAMPIWKEYIDWCRSLTVTLHSPLIQSSSPISRPIFTNSSS